MSRRGENIFKRKDGRYEGRYIKEYKNNRAVYGYVYANTYNECKKKRALISLKKTKEKRKNINLTLNSLILKWLNDKNNIKESSYTKYYNVINEYIKDEIGTIKVSKINDEVVKQYINKKRKQVKKNSDNYLSTSTIYAITNILMQVFKENKLDIKIEKIKVITKKGKSIDEKEKKNLEEVLFNDESKVATGILISLYLGLRQSEVCGLKWENIDLDKKIININQIVSRVKSFNTRKKTKLIITKPKTVNSNRILPLPEKIYKRMKKHSVGINNNCYLLTGTEKYMDPRKYYSIYKKILNSLNIEYTYHDLRHTFATKCVELGIDSRTLMELMGHSNIMTTLNLYVHPSLNNKRYYVDKL